MNKEKQTNFTEKYSTDSFILASLLLAESCRLLEVEKSNPQRANFIFEKTEKLDNLIKKFWAYEAFVEVHRYFNSQRDLKQILHGQ